MAKDHILQNTTDKEGPTVREVPARQEFRCYGCKHLRISVLRNGENPLKEYRCAYTAPAYKDDKATYIGYSDKTPDWCPVMWKRHHTNAAVRQSYEDGEVS